MLAFLVCVLGQFEPSGTQPTIDEFRAKSIAVIKAENVKKRVEIEKKTPNKKQIAKMPRTKSQAILKESKAALAAMDAAENANQPAIPQLVINRAKVGDVGLPMQSQDVSITTTVNGRSVLFQRYSTIAANLEVIEYLDDKAILCRCEETDIVLRNYKGTKIPTGQFVRPQGIHFASGTYRFGGDTLLTIEPWDHSDKYLEMRDQGPATKK